MLSTDNTNKQNIGDKSLGLGDSRVDGRLS